MVTSLTGQVSSTRSDSSSIGSLSTKETFSELFDRFSQFPGAHQDTNDIFLAGKSYYDSLSSGSWFLQRPPLCRARQWNNVYNDWRTVKILGQGTYGVVYKAERQSTSTDRGGDAVCALKRCKLDGCLDYGLPETALREITLLTELRSHPNIMNVKNVTCNAERMYIVCELLDMDVKQYLKSHQKMPLSISAIKSICRGLLTGVGHLHANGVVHRDLKPHNVLVSSDLQRIKIADMGLARHVNLPHKTLTHEVVTLWYRPPELLLGHCRYGAEIDVWSAGCIVAELLGGKAPFQGDSEIDTVFKIFRILGTPDADIWPDEAFSRHSDFPKFKGFPDPFGGLHPGLDAAGKDFLFQLLSVDPAKRPTIQQALAHPWLQQAARPSVSPIPVFGIADPKVVKRKLQLVEQLTSGKIGQVSSLVVRRDTRSHSRNGRNQSVIPG